MAGDEELERLVIGGSALPGIYTSLSPATATATIATALQLGCRNFDTAPHYGLGLGEERLGEALAASLDAGGSFDVPTRAGAGRPLGAEAGRPLAARRGGLERPRARSRGRALDTPPP